MTSERSRPELLQQLRQLGVERISAEYNGSGDDGQINDPEFGSVEVSGGVEKAVLDLFYEVLEEYYGGWEINEGSYGLFTWDVGADRINLLHTMRMDETEEKDL